MRWFTKTFSASRSGDDDWDLDESEELFTNTEQEATTSTPPESSSTSSSQSSPNRPQPTENKKGKTETGAKPKTKIEKFGEKLLKPFKPNSGGYQSGPPSGTRDTQYQKPAVNKTKKAAYHVRMKKYFCALKPRKFGYRVLGYNSGTNSPLLPKADEVKAIAIAKELFGCLIEHLAPALREYIVNNGMEPYTNSSTDGYRYLKTLIKRCRGNHLSFGGTKGPELNQLKKAMEGRNALCHGDLPLILAEWDNFLHAWIEVSNLVNDPVAAENMRHLHDRLVASDESSQIPTTPGDEEDSRENH